MIELIAAYKFDARILLDDLLSVKFKYPVGLDDGACEFTIEIQSDIPPKGARVVLTQTKGILRLLDAIRMKLLNAVSSSRRASSSSSSSHVAVDRKISPHCDGEVALPLHVLNDEDRMEHEHAVNFNEGYPCPIRVSGSRSSFFHNRSAFPVRIIHEAGEVRRLVLELIATYMFNAKVISDTGWRVEVSLLFDCEVVTDEESQGMGVFEIELHPAKLSESRLEVSLRQTHGDRRYKKRVLLQLLTAFGQCADVDDEGRLHQCDDLGNASTDGSELCDEEMSSPPSAACA